ncbi:hypothetical protein Tco_1384873 [Tanacetum coccineum]
MITAVTTAAMAAVVATMMEMTVASVRVVVVAMLNVVACSGCDGVKVVCGGAWRRSGGGMVVGCGDRDGGGRRNDIFSLLRELHPEAQDEVFVDGLGLAKKKVWIFLSDVIFTDCNVLSKSGCSFQSDLSVHDFDGFFGEMKLVVDLNFISRNGQGFVG